MKKIYSGMECLQCKPNSVLSELLSWYWYLFNWLIMTYHNQVFTVPIFSFKLLESQNHMDLSDPANIQVCQSGMQRNHPKVISWCANAQCGQIACKTEEKCSYDLEARNLEEQNGFNYVAMLQVFCPNKTIHLQKEKNETRNCAHWVAMPICPLDMEGL